MLALSQSMFNQPVMSLRTNDQVATADRPIINPNNLKIEGFYCTDYYSNNQLILVAQDLRDILDQGFVVNDYDVLVEASELVRLKKVLDLNFSLLGKPVQTVGGQKLGKVTDFAVETDSLYIQKLYVGQSMLKSFSGGSLSVSRTQIHEITHRRIIINDLLQGKRAGAPVPA